MAINLSALTVIVFLINEFVLAAIIVIHYIQIDLALAHLRYSGGGGGRLLID